MSFVVAPGTLAEAVAFLAAHPEALPMSGGATLVAMKNARLIEASHFVSLAGIDGLAGIESTAEGGLRIGAMTRHCDVAAYELLTGEWAALKAAAGAIAGRVVRNMGTIGGALGNGDPAADYLPALACLDAQVEITGPGGARVVSIADYVLGWYETALVPGEIITAALLPPDGAGASGGAGLYHKLARTPGDYAIASVAATVRDARARVAVGACGPGPIRDPDAEDALAGRLGEPEAVRAFGAALSAAADPVDDVRGSAEHRRRLIPRMVAAALREAAEMAQGSRA